jgi:uncharacterized protein YegL
VFPFTLTPLTSASTATSNISLYFSVTDSKGVGVAALPTIVKAPGVPKDPSDWVYKEDGADLDPKESGFTVSPLKGNTLDMPTVLVLDLSGSITGGPECVDPMNPDCPLNKVKQAAYVIIDSMLPEQRMAIVTFADKPTVRISFTTDTEALKEVVRQRVVGDGQSTNLYGAMVQAFSMWQDGFATMGGVKLTAGLAVVITDGKDNAGLSTISSALAARKNRRVVAVAINDKNNPMSVDTDALKQLATTGTYVDVKGYDTLGQEVSLITDAISTLGRSIYTANYCTPKLGGSSHDLLFTLKGNESTTTSTCTPATFPSGSCTNNPSFPTACGYSPSLGSYSCCPATAPFTCPNVNLCYRTAVEAAAKCGSATSGGTCVMCGGSGTGSNQDTGLLAGTAIHVNFDATIFKAGQCPLFWGPTCKALQTCCQQISSSLTPACTNQLLAALGAETTCQSVSNQYCMGDAGGPDGGADVRSDARSDGADGSLPPF